MIKSKVFAIKLPQSAIKIITIHKNTNEIVYNFYF